MVVIVQRSVCQKHDYIWMWSHDATSEPGIENNILNFNNGKRTLIRDTAGLQNDQANASMCDEDGNLLFYFNGCYIAGADHKLIENGDSINYSIWWNLIGNCSSGYTGNQDILIIPDPGNAKGYYIVHKTLEKVKINGLNDVNYLGLKYTYVDMTLNEGKGKVTSKNQMVYEDTLASGFIHAVKHANGRDWWIVDMKNPTFQSPTDLTYLVFLLNDHGIQWHHNQTMDYQLDHNTSAAGSAKFSPSGDRYAHYSFTNGLWFMDFDRETGAFSNFDYYRIKHKNWSKGLEWSASSRYLYVSATDSLFQYDTNVQDIGSSEQLVGVWDGTYNPLQTYFGVMQRGPDCKIYMSSFSSTRSIHIINNPDESAPFCGFEQNGLALFATTGTLSMPTFPNYRLDIGPICDPNIVPEKTKTAEELTNNIDIFPNPAFSFINIKHNFGLGELTVKVFDNTGREVKVVSIKENEELPVADLSDGIYIIKIITDGSVRGIKKLVLMK